MLIIIIGKTTDFYTNQYFSEYNKKKKTGILVENWLPSIIQNVIYTLNILYIFPYYAHSVQFCTFNFLKIKISSFSIYNSKENLKDDPLFQPCHFR